MGKKRLGDFIRKVDFLNISEDDANEAGNELQDVEGAVLEDEDFEEVKDGLLAFAKKVGVPNFPQRHSGGYWFGYSAINILTRIVGYFDEDEKAMKAFGKLYLDTWLALLQGGPSSGQTDLMSQLQTTELEEHIKTLDKKQMGEVFSKMKITFKYNPRIETDHDERLYADLVHSAIAYFFSEAEQEQLVSAQKEFLVLYQHYQNQLPELSEDFTTYVGYLLRDMAEGFPDENPFAGMTESTGGSGGGKPANDTEHLKMLTKLICDKNIKSEDQLDGLKVDKSLEGIIDGAVKNKKIPEIIGPLMELVIEFSKSPGSEFGRRIYGPIIFNLLRQFEKVNYKPDVKVFEAVLDMVCSIIVNAKLTDEIERLVKESVDDCIFKFPKWTPVHAKKVVDFMTEILKTGKTDLVKVTIRILREKVAIKHILWKNYIEEAKTMMEIVGKKPLSEMEAEKGRDDDVKYRDIISAYEDFCEYFLESLRKAKVANQVQTEIVQLIFNCLEIDNPMKAPIADESSNDLNLVKPDPKFLVKTLQKVKDILTNEDITMNIDVICAIQDIVVAVIESYDDNGKLVTPEQHKLIVDIFNITMEGETCEGHFMDDEDNDTVFFKLYQCAVVPYYVVHRDSGTVDCFIDVLPGVIKWAKIAVEEDCEKVQEASFMILSCMSVKTVKGTENYLKDLMDLMFLSDGYDHLHMLIANSYPNNPNAVHERLQEIFDRFPMLKDDEQRTVMNIVMAVSQHNPQAFTEQQIASLMEWATDPKIDDSLLLVIIRYISEKQAKVLLPHMEKFFKPDKGAIPMMFSVKLYIIGNVVVLDQKVSEKALDFMVTCFNHKDPSVVHVLTGMIATVMKKNPDYMSKYRKNVEQAEAKATTPAIKDGCRHILNILDGKVIEEVYDDLQDTKDNVNDLDAKVGATMDTVITLGDHVVEHDKDIYKLGTELDDLEERVDDVEDDLGETKVKVEEIDNKTMTNAPKWSRDLTKLMNPKSETDWRLLAQRLGYSNDDIRGWAQQNDPCMAVLSEWYATHKTSEATHAILKILEDMNRTDGLVIVENAMKSADGVVEDEEFEYAAPPPIFLSYQWGMQEEVKLLKQHLSMAGFECWMDIGQMGGGDKLFNKIDDGIRAAKLVISCTTEKYAKSPNCNREVNLAVNLGKPIIPLLMEKMAWPPKGSMGPIFSEYLFIRFFQRGGEETKDNRYWPLPKFNELLMQINFYVVPDQSLVQKEYKNWWNPQAEEIKIDKNKGKGKPATAAQSNTDTKESSEESPLVFLSYQWGKQPQVIALYKRLLSLGYTIWMDIHQMGGGDSLYDKIDRGLRGCKVVVSCVTPKYALSANCRREVSLADALKKPIIPLLLEEMKWPPDGPMSMVYTELLFINMWRDTAIQVNWTGPKVDELLMKLQSYVPGIQQAGDKSGKGNQKSSAPAENKEKSKQDSNETNKAEQKPKPEERKPINKWNEDTQKTNQDTTPPSKQAETKQTGGEPKKSKSCMIL